MSWLTSTCISVGLGEVRVASPEFGINLIDTVPDARKRDSSSSSFLCPNVQTYNDPLTSR